MSVVHSSVCHPPADLSDCHSTCLKYRDGNVVWQRERVEPTAARLSLRGFRGVRKARVICESSRTPHVRQSWSRRRAVGVGVVCGHSSADWRTANGRQCEVIEGSSQRRSNNDQPCRSSPYDARNGSATRSGLPGADPKHVFISYVNEDTPAVEALCRVLDRAGVPYWRDRRALAPGDAWKVKIRDAIRSESLVFLACFSTTSVAKQKSYMNEELSRRVHRRNWRHEPIRDRRQIGRSRGRPPFPRDSGKISGNLHRPKRYDRRLLRACFISAQVAARWNPESRAYYQRKRAEGKNHKQAVLCLARRRINVIWALLRDETEYRPRQVAGGTHVRTAAV